MCQCSFLSQEQFPLIAQTFDEAFADYYLKSTRKADQWLHNRCIKNGVRYGCSVGAFDGDRMVGFTLVGLDEWNGEPAAFDAGTGIVPEYRGRGLANRMFDFGADELRRRGVTKFLLEVLQVNQPAIKAYQKSGFSITREFDCLGLDRRAFQVNDSQDIPVEIKPVAQNRVKEFIGFADWQPSWENSFAAIARIPDEVILRGAFADNEPVGFLAYYPLLNWIMSLVVRRDYRRKGVATALLANFLGDFDGEVAQINLVNVDRSDVAMPAFLQKMGFKLFTSQYEMEMQL